MPDPIVVEVCVGSIEGALAAAAGGAQRVELCAALLEGGLTPSAGTIEIARQQITIGLQVMIRPRGGDFLYSRAEHASMRCDVETARRLGADGVVVGLLTANGDVDLDATRALVEIARPMHVTFHRAFDMARDPFAALEALVGLGIDRVLSSGQEASALEGADRLRDLVERADGRIGIMPGGGIHERNIGKILATTGAREIHVTGTRVVESRMAFRNDRCFMGGELRPAEFSTPVTDADRIRTLVRLTRGGGATGLRADRRDDT